MKVIKVLFAGVVVEIFSAIVGFVTCGWLFNWVYKLPPTDVWKPMEGPPGLEVYIGGLILSIILALIYAIVQKGIPGKNKIAKGIVFGLCVWAVGTLPGMFATWAFMTVAETVIIYWTILALVVTPIKGIIIAAIYGE